jgi:hypothetical protein
MRSPECGLRTRRQGSSWGRQSGIWGGEQNSWSVQVVQRLVRWTSLCHLLLVYHFELAFLRTAVWTSCCTYDGRIGSTTEASRLKIKLVIIVSPGSSSAGYSIKHPEEKSLPGVLHRGNYIFDWNPQWLSFLKEQSEIM